MGLLNLSSFRSIDANPFWKKERQNRECKKHHKEKNRHAPDNIHGINIPGETVNYNPRDHFFRKAKEQNFAARSVFKLEEIDKKFKILKPGFHVLDLGASPGSWSQFASAKVGPKGYVLGIDLNPVTVSIKNGDFIVGDIHQVALREEMTQRGQPEFFDVVLSDMAPKTTGIRMTDQARSFELCEMALQVAAEYLRPGGHFVCKFFHSDDFQKLRDRIKAGFERCEAIRPESTRTISKEIFLVGLRKK